MGRASGHFHRLQLHLGTRWRDARLHFAESFPAAVRYTGVSLGYQVGAALFGGPLPLIATALVARYNSTLPVGFVVIAFGVIALIALAFTRDRTGQPLDD